MLILHLVVFIWGFTGVLGALIELEALDLVIYRTGIAAISLAIFALLFNKSLKAPRALIVKLGATGFLVAAHWSLFFYSIKISTISIGLICISSTTLFTGLLEPLFHRQKVPWVDVFFGIVVLGAISLIFKFETQYTEGIIAGLACALLVSVFSILNSSYVKQHSVFKVAFYEMGGACLFLLAVSIGYHNGWQLPWPSDRDWIYLLLLGTLCTSVAFVASIYVMKKLSAFTVALVTNLEPIYGVLIALAIFKEKEFMQPGFYLGSAILLAAVFVHPLVKKKWST